MKTVIGVYQSKDSAEQAVHLLLKKGFKNQISVITRDQQQQGDSSMQMQSGGSDYTQTSGGTDDNSPATGAWSGGVLGGIAGLALGAGALAIPGIGPILAVGPLAGVISGAVTGGVAGGLIDWGIPADRSNYYEDKVKQGKVLISVRTDDQKASSAQEVLQTTGASDVETH